MEQKFEGTPAAEIRLDGRKLIRGPVTNDWGLRLQWVVSRGGEVVATANARTSTEYEPPADAPGQYEAVLQMWKYVDYRKDAKGEFVNSKFIDVSNKVTFTV
ncbi:MAG: hypothetical protein KY476_03515 [Planctomycetes bacterium]|nr:hypothetical protein [Planctomycetota bacterium]